MSYQLYLNALITGASAVNEVGMVPSHAEAFMRIARQQGCVISSRALGQVCRGLAEEGYDSKGFRIKAKTCNFGPMAGFVCRNPSFSKLGAAHAGPQEDAHRHALNDTDHVGWRAGLQQICISEARRGWLEANGYANTQPLATADTRWGTVAHPVRAIYLMRREMHDGDSVWALYETSEPLDTKASLRRSPWDSLAKRPMTALVNPYPAWGPGHYKNAVTGDYDLFAVWPQRANYDPLGEDRRIAGMPANQQARDAQIAIWEDRKLGNISDRVHTVAQMINSSLPKPGNCARDMLHHSDEAGRPGVSQMELPVIAFVPAPGMRNLTVAANNLFQMRALAQMCNELGFQIIVNAGWRAQLGNLGATGDATGWRTPLNSPVRGR